MTSLVEAVLIFAFITWGLAFLLADAKIFGCSAKGFCTALGDNDHTEADWFLTSQGLFKLRNFFLRFRFFRGMLSCYFCLGVWCGPMAHLILRWGTKDNQLIQHPTTVQGWTLGLLACAALGGTCCYLIDLIIGALERVQN